MRWTLLLIALTLTIGCSPPPVEVVVVPPVSNAINSAAGEVFHTCTSCYGSGQVTYHETDRVVTELGIAPGVHECPACKGAGELPGFIQGPTEKASPVEVVSSDDVQQVMLEIQAKAEKAKAADAQALLPLPPEPEEPETIDPPIKYTVEEFFPDLTDDTTLETIFDLPAEEPVSEPAEVVVEWDTDQPVTTQAADEPVYFVTETWCPHCPRGKRYTQEADVSFQEIGMNDAESRGFFLPGKTRGIPRLVYGSNTDDMLIGVFTPDSIRKWRDRQSPPVQAIPEAVVTATIHDYPSSSHVAAALAEHLARSVPENDIPVGGLFSRDVPVPEQIPEILSILMAGEPVEISEAGLSLTWTGDNRSIGFMSPERIQFTPPINIRLKKWKVTVRSTLSGVDISDNGRTVRFEVKGPDFTIRFVPDEFPNE